MADVMLRRPFAPLVRLRTDFENLFEDLLPDGWMEGENGSRMWTPLMDVSETETEYLAKMDLPGLEKNDIKVKVEDHQLTISGVREEETREEDENYFRIERRHGNFFRSLPLPENAKSEGINAEIKNGVLMVHIPKSEKRKAKEIKVK